MASLSLEEAPTSLAVTFVSSTEASVSPASPLCNVREVPFSMAGDSISPMGAYASSATEEAHVKIDRHPAPVKGLIWRGFLGSRIVSP